MSKFKEFIKKVASKFSTPVKPLAAEVFEEEKGIKISKDSIELGNFKIHSNGDVHITSEKGINLTVGNQSSIVETEMIETPFSPKWTKKETVKNPDLNRRMKKTKSTRIKKKIQKRIDEYGKNTITRN
ncbi:hypothetical protein HUB98_05960 [Paenibacillus barcinonensis]|uniref:Uncharacterized protein n=1 Tax=Paenibacillus barcinonensis TaxID=198119 RepID=A0A2V4W8A8_PAEBA|nr:hypothetical protein [Paenibacillus barcinonensis]PYE51553.1 hypothetical protein DFQ00_102347 [Paenibacillus barcinonensis]QKS55926.1 hypothetical protein HUB98_05960 [Paenibacillus barcinonensis]